MSKVTRYITVRNLAQFFTLVINTSIANLIIIGLAVTAIVLLGA